LELSANFITHSPLNFVENMAKKKGAIKLDGTIGDITFYKTQDGYLAREKGCVTADCIAHDPAFNAPGKTGRNLEERARVVRSCATR
jgi:hypothetical protein